MEQKTKLEEFAKALIAYKLITSVTGTISDRAKRKYEKLGERASKVLKGKSSLSKDSNLTLRLGWSDKAISWARKISLALEEFKQENPKAYEQFEEIREKHKKIRRAYLEFGGNIPNEIYIETIKEIFKKEGISDEKARQFYEIIREIGNALGKTQGLQRLLLEE